MAKADNTRRKAGSSRRPIPRVPTIPPELVPVVEHIYSVVAIAIAALESQAADRDTDAARVLRNGALSALGTMLFHADPTKGGVQ